MRFAFPIGLYAISFSTRVFFSKTMQFQKYPRAPSRSASPASGGSTRGSASWKRTVPAPTPASPRKSRMRWLRPGPTPRWSCCGSACALTATTGPKSRPACPRRRRPSARSTSTACARNFSWIRLCKSTRR